MLKKLSFYLLSIASFALPLSFVVSCSNSKDTKPNTNENPKPDENTKPNDEGGNSNGSGESNKPNGDGGQNGGNGESNKPNGDGGQNGGSGDSNKPNGDNGQGGGNGDSNGSKPKPIGPELQKEIDKFNQLKNRDFNAKKGGAKPTGTSLVSAITNGDNARDALTTNFTKNSMNLDGTNELLALIDSYKDKPDFSFTIAECNYSSLYTYDYQRNGMSFKINISYKNEKANTNVFRIKNTNKITVYTLASDLKTDKSYNVNPNTLNPSSWINDTTDAYTALFGKYDNQKSQGVLSENKDPQLIKIKDLMQKLGNGFAFKITGLSKAISTPEQKTVNRTFSIKIKQGGESKNSSSFTLTGFVTN